MASDVPTQVPTTAPSKSPGNPTLAERYRRVRFPRASVEALALDDRCRVGRSLPCYRCRYDLRSRVADGDAACPECGALLAPSLFDSRLALNPTGWGRRVGRGLYLVVAGWLGLVVCLALLVWLSALGLPRVVNEVVLPLAGWLLCWVCAAAVALGAWRYTSPEGYVGRPRWVSFPLRWGVRVSAALRLGWFVGVPVLVAAASWAGGYLDDLRGQSDGYLGALADVAAALVPLLVLVAVPLLPVLDAVLIGLCLAYAGVLTLRVPSWKASAWVVLQGLVFAVAAGVAGLAAGLLAGLPVFLFSLILGNSLANEVIDPGTVDATTGILGALYVGGTGVVVLLALIAAGLAVISLIISALCFAHLLLRQCDVRD